MRFPVKFNRAADWPQFLTQNLPSAVDPRVLCQGRVNETVFTSAISTFKFGSTFKSTQKARFPLTVLELGRLEFQVPPVILDVGASDGSTSLDLMQAVPYEKYFVTDLNIEVYYETSGPVTWFYDENGACLLRVTDKWVVYPDIGGAIFPFNLISQSLFKQAPKFQSDIAKILLINPDLLARKDSRVVVAKHNIFDTWPSEKADLIIAANILNRVYFTASELELALKKLLAALKDTGRMVIIDNRPGEKSSFFQFSPAGSVRVEKRVNGGTEIEALALKTFEASLQPVLEQV
jgi:hypothetical protein